MICEQIQKNFGKIKNIEYLTINVMTWCQIFPFSVIEKNTLVGIEIVHGCLQENKNLKKDVKTHIKKSNFFSASHVWGMPPRYVKISKKIHVTVLRVSKMMRSLKRKTELKWILGITTFFGPKNQVPGPSPGPVWKRCTFVQCYRSKEKIKNFIL